MAKSKGKSLVVSEVELSVLCDVLGISLSEYGKRLGKLREENSCRRWGLDMASIKYWEERYDIASVLFNRVHQLQRGSK